MNVFILTDLEGIAGVDSIEYMDRGSEKYASACHMLEHSLNLAICAAREAGAEDIYYLDGHGGGGNINPVSIDTYTKKCSISDWQELLRCGSIDCQIELGSHARAGTIGGFLDHTISSKSWFSHKVNGKEQSELSMHALLCGKYGVPIVACIGDETACNQAKEYIPDIFTGAVKNATERNLATTYENADEILTETVKRALKNYKKVSIYTTPEPAEIELTYYRTDMCEQALASCPDSVRRTDARTLTKTVKQILRYEDLKF